MILAGYEYGKEYISAPVLGPIVFCIATNMMGILLIMYMKRQRPSGCHLYAGATNAFTILHIW